MGDRGDRHLLLEDVLRLLVQLGALGLVGRGLGLLDQVVVGLVAPLGEVVAVDGIATVEGTQPVVRVTIVTAPANQHGTLFAAFGALDVLAPFITDDLRLDTDLGPVGLEHFGHQLGIGVVRALHGHGPQGDFGAFLDAGFLEQLLGFLGVEGGVLDAVVIRPLRGRHGVDRQLAGALVHRLDDLFLVHGHVQRLSDFQLGHGVGLVAALDLVHHVVGDIAEVEAGLLRHLQVLVGF
ncbi:hypothetical protein D3C76_962440 [compost metagenome]